MSDKELLQQALDALIIAEAGLADIGDADREPGDDLKWCEARAAQALESPRQAIVALAAAIAQPVQPARSAAMNRMHTRIAMVQALSWLENHGAVVFSGGGMTSVDSMNAVAKRLRNALASPQPVQPDDVQRVLTDAEIVRIHNRYGGDMVNCARAIERAVEAEVRKQIETAVLAEREECAQVCESLAVDYRNAYKGRASSYSSIPYDPHTDGMGDGATQCDIAIRERTQPIRIDDAHTK